MHDSNVQVGVRYPAQGCHHWEVYVYGSICTQAIQQYISGTLQTSSRLRHLSVSVQAFAVINHNQELICFQNLFQ